MKVTRRLLVFLLFYLLVSLSGTPAWAAADLAYFFGDWEQDGLILTWGTNFEDENGGFNIYRSDVNLSPQSVATDSRAIKINDATLHHPANCTSDWADYEFIDSTAEPDKTYYYYLESLDCEGGGSTFYGDSESSNGLEVLALRDSSPPATRTATAGVPAASQTATVTASETATVTASETATVTASETATAVVTVTPSETPTVIVTVTTEAIQTIAPSVTTRPTSVTEAPTPIPTITTALPGSSTRGNVPPVSTTGQGPGEDVATPTVGTAMTTRVEDAVTGVAESTAVGQTSATPLTMPHQEGVIAPPGASLSITELAAAPNTAPTPDPSYQPMSPLVAHAATPTISAALSALPTGEQEVLIAAASSERDWVDQGLRLLILTLFFGIAALLGVIGWSYARS